MPQNPIQFQPGMSLDEFFEQYGTEAQCEAALERARWPCGFVCPRCGGTAHSTFLVDGHKVWQCSQCRAQTTLRSGTLFHGSKLPLRKWFQAIYLVTQNKNNISALSLMRHLGICYRSAWRLKHKLMEAMAEREAPRTLSGTVVAEDACLAWAARMPASRGADRRTRPGSWRPWSSLRTTIRSISASTRCPISPDAALRREQEPLCRRARICSPTL
jgi:transposase-like protein